MSYVIVTHEVKTTGESKCDFFVTVNKKHVVTEIVRRIKNLDGAINTFYVFRDFDEAETLGIWPGGERADIDDSNTIVTADLVFSGELAQLVRLVLK